MLTRPFRREDGLSGEPAGEAVLVQIVHQIFDVALV